MAANRRDGSSYLETGSSRQVGKHNVRGSRKFQNELFLKQETPDEEKTGVEPRQSENKQKTRNKQNVAKNVESKTTSPRGSAWSRSSERKDGISFAEMLKKNYPVIEKPVSSLPREHLKSKLVSGSRPKRLITDR